MPIWLNIINLFIIGFFLIFVEVVIIPGFGLPGILGSIALIAACYTAFTMLSPLFGLLVCAASITMVFIIFRILPKTKIWQKTSLKHDLNHNRGYHVGSDDLINLIGKKGTAFTMLRPSGTIIIDDKHYDAVSNGDFIAKGKNIIVDKVENNKIIVTENDAE